MLAACVAAPSSPAVALIPAPTATPPVVSAPIPVTGRTGSSPAIAFKPAGEIDGLTIKRSDGDLWLKVFGQQGVSTENPGYWVTGEAPAGTLVDVGGSRYRTGPDQRFSIYVGLEDGPNEIEVVASNAQGRQVNINLFIFYNQAP